MNLRSFFVLAFIGLLVGCAADADHPIETLATENPTYVSETECVECHQVQGEEWTGSHHDLAMQLPKNAFVPDGPIQPFAAHGIVSSVRMSGSDVFVTTDDSSGTHREFPVSAVFGVAPLQQFVIDAGGGYRQVTTVAMNTTTGQLFSVRGSEKIDHRDELHWTHSTQNWNYMCAECHATGLKRSFDAASQTFSTTAHRFDVGCQACHGPASEHVLQARDGYSGQGASGFGTDISSATGLQVETCARCHSRRAPLGDGYDLTASLHDDYRVSLLDEGLYYPDGQIKEEVYVYGSFVQSKMYHAGVQCSDCHNPHSGKTNLPGNNLCASCHNSGTPAAGEHINVSGLKHGEYDDPQHHNHKKDLGIECVDCHAPTTTYMQVDDRRDHSFRIPRPDLSEKYGVPNACNSCHTDKSTSWTSRAFTDWYGEDHEWHFVEAIDAGQKGSATAPGLLSRVVRDLNQPAIVRATALDLLARYPSASTSNIAPSSLNDASPLVRRAAITAHASMQSAEVQQDLRRMLNDRARSVRFEALTFIDLSVKDPALIPSIQEYVTVQQETGGSGSAQLNLGSLRLRMGDRQAAERHFRKSVAINEHFVPGWVNLADVVRYRDEREAEQILKTALDKLPKAALLYYVLGLSLTRQQRMDEAIRAFEQAVSLDADNVQFRQVLQMAEGA